MDIGIVIMDASILAAIVLCIVGFLKLFFKKFKEKHPKGYTATFCGVSLLLIIGITIFCEFIFLSGNLWSVEFATLLISTMGFTYTLYHSYEGLGGKELGKKLIAKITELFSKNKTVKAKKLIEELGISTLITLNSEIQAEKRQAATQAQQTTNNTK